MISENEIMYSSGYAKIWDLDSDKQVKKFGIIVGNEDILKCWKTWKSL